MKVFLSLFILVAIAGCGEKQSASDQADARAVISKQVTIAKLDGRYIGSEMNCDDDNDAVKAVLKKDDQITIVKDAFAIQAKTEVCSVTVIYRISQLKEDMISLIKEKESYSGGTECMQLDEQVTQKYEFKSGVLRLQNSQSGVCVVYVKQNAED